MRPRKNKTQVPASKDDLIFLDVETTGLSPAYGHRVIEVAALRVKDFKPADEFYSLVDPERDVSFGAYLVNGIEAEALIGAPKAGDIMPDLFDFLGEAYIVGHHISFDLNFLSHEATLCGHPRWMPAKVIDTLKMARGLLPSSASYSLASVAQALGLTQRQQHRARGDVHLTFEVFMKLMKLAKDKSIGTLETLAGFFGDPSLPPRDSDNKKLALLKEAIGEAKDVQLNYFSPARSDLTQRRVTPKGLIEGKRTVKLIGFCHLRNEEREFRLERILSVQKL